MTANCDSDNQFRYKLKCLSDQLTPGDLDNLKNLCSGHINVEKITSGIMLWRSLQDSGKLNLDYLKILFTDIGKVHLYETIFSPTSNGVDSQSAAVIPQPIQEGNYGTGNTLEFQYIQCC